ncbi:hypothetical protein Nepgr_016937 [Nepenthes gracilis]|uniref:Uncharacterized protein n=1 Tax=Nepenthes gracilis TaxID=150966 RepID=A0AAD3SRJ8_NEPGR|nr:hypothetical protein Nepgr_016937 [Nepenthes gracilis]
MREKVTLIGGLELTLQYWNIINHGVKVGWGDHSIVLQVSRIKISGINLTRLTCHFYLWRHSKLAPRAVFSPLPSFLCAPSVKSPASDPRAKATIKVPRICS